MKTPARIRRRSARHGEAGYKRRNHDAYFTEPRATRALMQHVDLLRGRVWECAAGKGHIVQILRAHGCDVVATDLVDHKAPGTIRTGVDFLTTRRLPKGVRAIVTNPPFGDDAEAFIRHALKLTRGARDAIVAMLLPLEHDTTKGRLDLYDRAPFAMEIVMCWRLVWIEGTDGGGRNSHAWFVWDARMRAANNDNAVKRYVA